MSSRQKYKTKQKDILLGYLETVEGKHITAGDVCDYFKSCGTPIGQATIYRRLEGLVDEGVLNKYIIDSNSPACFEYTGMKHEPGGPTCFHCKCEKCGRLIHMHCSELEGIAAHLEAEHGFKINPMRTVFYGVCDECKNKE